MFEAWRPRPAVALLICGMLTIAIVTTHVAAQGGGQVGGRVVDHDGKGVVGLTIRFTAQDGSEIKATSKKKGRFFARGVPRGVYTVDLVEPELFVLKLEFRMKSADGLTLGQGELDGDPRRGVQGVTLSDRHEVTLTLITASRDSAEARGRSLAVALPELAEAADAFNAGDFEQAAARATAIIADNPELGEALYVQAVAFEKLGRLADAETALRMAIEQIPDYPQIWGTLGEVTLHLAGEYEEAGKQGEAKAAFARAIDPLIRASHEEPDSMPLRLALAAALDHSGDEERLIPVLQSIIEADPSRLQMRLRLAGLYSKRGRQEEAMTLLREIPATEKSAAITMYNIAVRLNEDGDADAALLVARRAAEMDAALAPPWQLIAQILLARNERPEAAQAIHKFLELAPAGPEADSYRRILEQIE